MQALHRCRRELARQTSRFARRLGTVAVILPSCVLTATAVGAIPSYADVGELGPPPIDSEIRQALTEFYDAGHPPDSTIDVQFVGPILVGPPTVHPNPPPKPWCVRCGYPDQGASPMYPVDALVSVTTTQGLGSSALSPTGVVRAATVTEDGTSCPGETAGQYCPTYFFYRDDQGRWQVA